MSKELSSRVFVNNASGNKNAGQSQPYPSQDTDSSFTDPPPNQQSRPAFTFQPAMGRVSLNGGAAAAAAQQLNLVEQIPMMGDINVSPPFTSQQRTRDEGVVEHSISNGLAGDSTSQLSSSRLTLQNGAPHNSQGVRKVRGSGTHPSAQHVMVMSVPLSAINQHPADEMAAERASQASSGLGGPPGSFHHAHKHSGSSHQQTGNNPKMKSMQRKQTSDSQQRAGPMHYRQGRKLSKQDFIQIEQQAPDFAENFEESAASFIPVKDTRGDSITISNQQNQSYNSSSCQRSSQQFSNNHRAVMDTTNNRQTYTQAGAHPSNGRTQQHNRVRHGEMEDNDFADNENRMPNEEQVVMENQSSHGRRRV